MQALLHNQQTRIRYSIITLFVITLVFRVILFLNVNQDDSWPNGEMENAIKTFSQEGFLGNVFTESQGRSAHLSPIYPVLVGVVHKILGTGSKKAIWCQKFISSIFTSLEASLMPLFALSLGLSIWIGAIAGLIIALSPIQVWVETSGTWDTSFTAFLAIVTIILFFKVSQDEWKNYRKVLIFGFCLALTIFASPVVLPGFFLIMCIELFKKLKMRIIISKFIKFCTIGIILFLMILPWGLRNQKHLGAFIPFRSNFGLELMIGNNDNSNGKTISNDWLDKDDYFFKMHPSTSINEQERLVQIGEVAYMQEKMNMAKTWIKKNPQKFIDLTVSRIMLFWFPPVHMWPDNSFANYVKCLIYNLLTITAIAGAVLLVLNRRYLLVIQLLLLSFGFSFIYYITHVEVRYRYILWWLTVFMSSVFIYHSVLYLKQLVTKRLFVKNLNVN